MSFVTTAAWEGDTVNSGLIGLAFPGLTSVFSGTNPDDDSESNNLIYNPFPFQAVAEKVISAPSERKSQTL